MAAEMPWPAAPQPSSPPESPTNTQGSEIQMALQEHEARATVALSELFSKLAKERAHHECEKQVLLERLREASQELASRRTRDKELDMHARAVRECWRGIASAMRQHMGSDTQVEAQILLATSLKLLHGPLLDLLEEVGFSDSRDTELIELPSPRVTGNVEAWFNGCVEAVGQAQIRKEVPTQLPVPKVSGKARRFHAKERTRMSPISPSSTSSVATSTDCSTPPTFVSARNASSELGGRAAGGNDIEDPHKQAPIAARDPCGSVVEPGTLDGKFAGYDELGGEEGGAVAAKAPHSESWLEILSPRLKSRQPAVQSQTQADHGPSSYGLNHRTEVAKPALGEKQHGGTSGGGGTGSTAAIEKVSGLTTGQVARRLLVPWDSFAEGAVRMKDEVGGIEVFVSDLGVEGAASFQTRLRLVDSIDMGQFFEVSVWWQQDSNAEEAAGVVQVVRGLVDERNATDMGEVLYLRGVVLAPAHVCPDSEVNFDASQGGTPPKSELLNQTREALSVPQIMSASKNGTGSRGEQKVSCAGPWADDGVRAESSFIFTRSGTVGVLELVFLPAMEATATGDGTMPVHIQPLKSWEASGLLPVNLTQTSSAGAWPKAVDSVSRSLQQAPSVPLLPLASRNASTCVSDHAASLPPSLFPKAPLREDQSREGELLERRLGHSGHGPVARANENSERTLLVQDRWDAHPTAVWALTLGAGSSADSVFSGGHDGVVKEWCQRAGESGWYCRRAVQLHSDAVLSLAWCGPLQHGGGGLLISGSADCLAKVTLFTAGAEASRDEHDMESGCTVVATLDRHSQRVGALAVLDAYVATGSADDSVILWEKETWCPAATLRGHSDSVLVLSQLRDFLCSGSCDGTICVWSRRDRTWELLRRLTGHSGSVLALAVLPLNRSPESSPQCLLASASDDKTIRLWDYENDWHECTVTVGHEDSVTLLAVCDGPADKANTDPYLLSFSDDHTARVWEVGAGGHLAEERRDRHRGSEGSAAAPLALTCVCTQTLPTCCSAVTAGVLSGQDGATGRGAVLTGSFDGELLVWGTSP